MEPRILAKPFGSITVVGRLCDQAIVMRLGATVITRKKKLSKWQDGPSHKVSRDEAESGFEQGVQRWIVGKEQSDVVQMTWSK